MKPHEIENWVLSIIEHIKSGQPIEDSRVELKSNWPVAQKAARQIAGHANAARGEPILWLIGVDEKKGVIGATNIEIANWYPAVKAQFDGIAPSVTNLNVPVKGTTVIALLFETDRAPFVVKNPDYGSKKGEAIEFEVPWREGTYIRTANRSDLIKLLSPLQKLPSIEVLSGRLTVEPVGGGTSSAEQKLKWHLDLKLYVTPKTGTRVVIPFHRCEATFEILESVARTPFERMYLSPPIGFGRGISDISIASQSLTIDVTETEVLIDGPGMLRLSAYGAETPVIAESFANPAEIIVNLLPADAERPVQISETLVYSPSVDGKLGSWVLNNSI